MRATLLLLLLVAAARAQERPPAGPDPTAAWTGQWLGEGGLQLQLERIGMRRVEGQTVPVVGGELSQTGRRSAVEAELRGEELTGTCLDEAATRTFVARLDGDELVLRLDDVELRLARHARPRELSPRPGQRWEFALPGGRRRVCQVTGVTGQRVTYVTQELAPDALGNLEPVLDATTPLPPSEWQPEVRAPIGAQVRVETLRLGGRAILCQRREERVAGKTVCRWLALRDHAPAFPGEVRRVVDGQTVLELASVSDPPGPDLSQLRVGQRYVYRMAAGGVQMSQEWVITELGATSIGYTLQMFMAVSGQGNQSALGDPTPMEWPIPPPGSAPGPDEGPQSPGVRTHQEQVVVSGMTFDCLVFELETEGQVTRSWTPISAGQPTFPPIIRSELNGETIMDLVEVR